MWVKRGGARACTGACCAQPLRSLLCWPGTAGPGCFKQASLQHRKHALPCTTGHRGSCRQLSPAPPPPDRQPPRTCFCTSCCWASKRRPSDLCSALAACRSPPHCVSMVACSRPARAPASGRCGGSPAPAQAAGAARSRWLASGRQLELVAAGPAQSPAGARPRHPRTVSCASSSSALCTSAPRSCACLARSICCSSRRCTSCVCRQAAAGGVVKRVAGQPQHETQGHASPRTQAARSHMQHAWRLAAWRSAPLNTNQ
jgi:hypothetical protein